MHVREITAGLLGHGDSIDGSALGHGDRIDGSALGHGDRIDGSALGHRGGDRAPTTSPTVRSVNGDRADYMDGRT